MSPLTTRRPNQCNTSNTMPTDTESLTRCGRECMLAPSGHGRRWAKTRCTAALIGTGTPEPIATHCAAAMEAIAQHLAHVVAQAVAAPPAAAANATGAIA